MYKQTVQRKQRNAFISILLVVLLVFAILLAADLIGYAARLIGFAGAEYVVYVLLILLAVYIVRNRLTSYCYALSETELLLERLIGNRVRGREVIPLKSVAGYGAYEKQMKKGERLVFAYKPYEAAKILSVCEGGETYTIIISPDAEMDERLRALNR